MVPDPSIGKASTNPIPMAYKRGYFTLNPKKCKIYNPISDIINDTNTNMVSAFK